MTVVTICVFSRPSLSKVEKPTVDGAADCYGKYFHFSYRYLSCFILAYNNSQVGVAVNGDATRLEKHYSVETANTVDLRSYARSCWVPVLARGLAGMVYTVLERILPKDPAVRFSVWSSRELSTEQVRLAVVCRYLIQE